MWDGNASDLLQARHARTSLDSCRLIPLPVVHSIRRFRHCSRAGGYMVSCRVHCNINRSYCSTLPMIRRNQLVETVRVCPRRQGGVCAAFCSRTSCTSRRNCPADGIPKSHRHSGQQQESLRSILIATMLLSPYLKPEETMVPGKAILTRHCSVQNGMLFSLHFTSCRAWVVCRWAVNTSTRLRFLQRFHLHFRCEIFCTGQYIAFAVPA